MIYGYLLIVGAFLVFDLRKGARPVVIVILAVLASVSVSLVGPFQGPNENVKNGLIAFHTFGAQGVMLAGNIIAIVVGANGARIELGPGRAYHVRKRQAPSLLPITRERGFPQCDTRRRADAIIRASLTRRSRCTNLFAQEVGGTHQSHDMFWRPIGAGDPGQTRQAGGYAKPIADLLVERQALRVGCHCLANLALCMGKVAQPGENVGDAPGVSHAAI